MLALALLALLALPAATSRRGDLEASLSHRVNVTSAVLSRAVFSNASLSTALPAFATCLARACAPPRGEPCPASHPVATMPTSSGCCAFWTGPCQTCCTAGPPPPPPIGPPPIGEWQWSRAAIMNTARSFGAWVVLNNGSLLSVGGSDNDQFAGPATNTTELFDPQVGKWSRAADMLGWNNTLRRVVDGMGSATLLANGTVMACCSAQGYQLWNPATGQWSLIPHSLHARDGNCGQRSESPVLCRPSFPQVASLPNGSVVAVGGSVATITQNGGSTSFGGRSTVTAQIWDPRSGNWSNFPSMLFPRSLFGLLRLENGSLLAAGGFRSATSEIWVPKTGLWHRSGDLALGQRQNLNLVQIPTGEVFAVGGLTTNCDGQIKPCRRSPWATPSVERWDPNTGLWEVWRGMNSPAYCHALGQLGTAGMDNEACGRRSGVMAATLLNGSILTGGGTVQIGSNPRNYNWKDTELWQPLPLERGGGPATPAGTVFTCDHRSYACTLVNASSVPPSPPGAVTSFSSISACATACMPPPRNATRTNATLPNATARFLCQKETGSCVESIFGIEEHNCRTLCPVPPPTPPPPKPSPPPPPVPPPPPPPPPIVSKCVEALRQLCGTARQKGVFECGLCTGMHAKELKEAHCNATEPENFCST